MGMKEDGPKRPNKKLLYYYGIILLITVLLNALVMPALAERSVTEVTYDQFLDMLDNKYLLLLMAGILGGIFTLLAVKLCGPLAAAGLDWLYFALTGGIAVLLGVFGSIFNTYAGL